MTAQRMGHLLPEDCGEGRASCPRPSDAASANPAPAGALEAGTIYLVMFDARIVGRDAHRYARWVSSQVNELTKANEEIRRLRDGIAATISMHCGNDARESFDADAICDELKELLG